MSTPRKSKTETCLFCAWAKLLDRIEKCEINEDELSNNDSEWYNYQYLGRSRNFFAVLDRNPRMRGDTMIISRKYEPDHFTDIADSSLSEFTPLREDQRFIGEILRKLKGLTGDDEHGKVYVMSMCEHWEPDELKGSPSTEHLHFHLLPRHKSMRTKLPNFVPEHIFILCQDEYRPEELLQVKNEILKY